MSWLFSQALVAEYLADTCSDGEPSVPSSGNPTQQAYCAPDRMTAFSRLSRFGMTYKPLTEDRGAELLTSYLADFRARTSAPQGGGKGIDGERSGMWRHMARIVGEVLPRYVFVENSPLLVGRGLAVVLGDLAALGYDAHWCCVSASDIGAPHQRDRIWLVGNIPNTELLRRYSRLREQEGQQPGKWRPAWGEPETSCKDMADPQSQRRRETRQLRREEPAERPPRCSETLADAGGVDAQGIDAGSTDSKGRTGSQQRPAGPCRDGIGRWPAEPDVGRVAHGVAARVDRLKAIGNGQVPRVAATAWEILTT